MLQQQKNIKRSYQLMTKYPKEFEHCYWSGFEYDLNNEDQNRLDIFENRNKFIEDNKIIKGYSVSKVPKYITKEIDKLDKILRTDHIEYYFTKDNKFIILSSPYHVPEEDDITYNKEGWQKIYKLYAQEAETYMKVIAKRKR